MSRLRKRRPSLLSQHTNDNERGALASRFFISRPRLTYARFHLGTTLLARWIPSGCRSRRSRSGCAGWSDSRRCGDFQGGTRLSKRLGAIDDSKVLSIPRAPNSPSVFANALLPGELASFPPIRLIRLVSVRPIASPWNSPSPVCPPMPDFVLLDAITCNCDQPQSGLIDGDAISTSIAAASILAKTERDLIMRAAHTEYDRYGFDRHVGYGTAYHLAALRAHGPCDLHRRTFRGVLPVGADCVCPPVTNAMVVAKDRKSKRTGLVSGLCMRTGCRETLGHMQWAPTSWSPNGNAAR